MSEWREFFQQVVLDHYKRPRNFRRQGPVAARAEGHNPLCGDRVIVFVTTAGGALEDVSFDGTGCALSTASASLMTEALKGKTLSEAEALFHAFRDLATGRLAEGEADGLGDLALFAGVCDYPQRVKCVTLPWHAARAAMAGDHCTVSTE